MSEIKSLSPGLPGLIEQRAASTASQVQTQPSKQHPKRASRINKPLRRQDQPKPAGRITFELRRPRRAPARSGSP